MPIDRTTSVTCDFCQKELSGSYGTKFTEEEILSDIYMTYGWIKITDSIFCYPCQLTMLPKWDKISKEWNWPVGKPTPVLPQNP